MYDIAGHIQAEINLNVTDDAKDCICRGGWILSDWDSCHKCPIHYDGQPDPEDEDPAAWDYYEDTRNGNGQFMVISGEGTYSYPMGGKYVHGTLEEASWAWLARRPEKYDDFPF